MPEIPAPAVEAQTPVVAPVEAPKVETPADPVAPPPEAGQYDLPDGTKTDAAGLAKAWRDNFMPEYTRKSQELAAIKAKAEPQKEAPTDAKAPWENSEWQPNSYKELAEVTVNRAEQRVWQKILSEADRGERETKEREAYVQHEVEQLKALDPKVDTGRVMSHAAKYAFTSLVPAYHNMKALEDTERRTEERIMKNMKLRASEPVGTASAQASGNTTFPPDVRTGLEKARWLLRNNK